MKETRNVKIRMNATFHRLQINKAIKFQTRIQWKRHQNKVETRLVNHQHGFSIFQESLFLDLNMVYNQAKAIYEDKNTEIVAVIMYEGKIKSGGYAKYNIAQVLNNNLDGKLQNIPLSQCPDPNANVEVTFTFDSLEEDNTDTPSVLNASSRDLNMSRVDFHDDKISLQMDRINSTINKLGQLAKSIKQKQKTKSDKLPEMGRKIQQLQGQKAAYKLSLAKLQQKIQNKQKIYAQQKKKDQKIIADLEKQIQKKQKQFKSRQFIELDQQKKYKQELTKKNKEIQKYKKLCEQLQDEIQQQKNKDSRGSLGFGKMDVGDVHEIAKFESQKQDLQSLKELQRLKSQNNDLQIKVATSSFRVAQLFNAAYEIGGAKLLDELQKSIGLIEM